MTINDDLAKELDLLIPKTGVMETDVTNLTLIRREQVMENRCQLIYEPCIYVVVQGCKSAFLGDENYIYDALNYLVLSVPLPLECQILSASVEKPYLAMRIHIDAQVLIDLVQEFQPVKQQNKPTGQRGIFVTNLGSDITATLRRLLSYVNSPSSSQILAPMAIKELLFHVLQGKQGEQLRSFAYRDKHNFQIAQVIHFIQNNYSRNLDISVLASKTNMSQSSFFQYFKAVTNASPIQYIKTIRLHAARRNMLHNNLSASDAAFHVGYTSPSQFSREYRRLFGMAPSADIRNSNDIMAD